MGSPLRDWLWRFQVSLWLPSVQGADGILLGLSKAGRYLVAARAAFSPHHQLTHLDGFAAQLNALENQLRYGRNVFTEPFEEALRALGNAGERPCAPRPRGTPPG